MHLVAWVLEQTPNVEVSTYAPDCWACGCPNTCRFMFKGQRLTNAQLYQHHMDALHEARRNALAVWEQQQQHGFR